MIHLKRVGSACPFGRRIEEEIGCEGGRIGFECVGRLFGGGVMRNGIDEELDLNDDKHDGRISKDPWLYSSDKEANNYNVDGALYKSKRRHGELFLNPRLTHSQVLQSTLRSYNNIVQQGLLMTVNFVTVEDYLQRLQMCSEAISTCGSLALVYLAAAVSDFYIPLEKRVVHKIQSRDYGLESSESFNSTEINEDNTLTLTLYPVPKVIPTLRKEWCPNAFVASFKLETDSTILRQKAVMAMERNDVHLVIGNELKTRYEKVFILSRAKVGHFVDQTFGDASLPTNGGSSSDDYHLTEVTKNDSTHSSSPDALEDATVEHVVRHHFYCISAQVDQANPNLSSIELFARTTSEATKRHEARIQASYRRLQIEKLKARMMEAAWTVAGTAVGMVISYGVSRMLQQRQQVL